MPATIESTIFSEIITPSPAEEAFSFFVDHLQEWWPKEYTWSKQGLKKMTIAPYVDGHCFEMGPYDFRCDWGRVLEFERPYQISFSWQINTGRVPEPDPEKASKVTVSFKPLEDKTTRVRLIHSQLDKHGPTWEEYAQQMNSDKGWAFILEKLKQSLETYHSRPRKVIP